MGPTAEPVIFFFFGASCPTKAFVQVRSQEAGFQLILRHLRKRCRPLLACLTVHSTVQRPQQLFCPAMHQALASHTVKYLPAHLQKVPLKKKARKRRRKRQRPGNQKANHHQTIPISEFNAFALYSRSRSKLTHVMLCHERVNLFSFKQGALT